MGYGVMLILLRVDGLDHKIEVRILGVIRKTKERIKKKELIRKINARLAKVRMMKTIKILRRY
jgi:hypothetical protein